METINFKKTNYKKIKVKNFPRSFNAISPVIATLLIIVIVVVASLVVFAWVSGYIGFQTSKTGQAIEISSVALTSDGLHVYVQNVGQSVVTLGAVYVNDEREDFTPDPNYSTNVLPQGNTANILVEGSYVDSAKLNIKVTTTDGTFMTKTGTVSYGSQNPSPTSSADNTVPTLTPIDDQTVDELSTLTFTAFASDSDVPTQTLTFSLAPGAPADATIDPASGVFAWVPGEDQGSAIPYSLSVIVTDDGSPNLSAQQTFIVTVADVNQAPVLHSIGDQTVNELSELTFIATSTDPDQPVNTLTYSLINAPIGANIDPDSGVFTWIPTEAQGPGDYSFALRVTDNGSPAMYAEQTINIHVNEVSSTPQTITLRPNAAGSSTHLDSQGTSPNFACINEDPDNTNNYVRGTSSDNWQQDSYNFADQSLSGNINSVTVHIIVRKSGSSNDNHLDAYSIVRLSSGTVKTGQIHDLTSTWIEYSDSYTTKPSELGSGTWTWNDVNDLQIGVGLRSHESSSWFWHDWTYAQCTQVWVEINYTPS